MKPWTLVLVLAACGPSKRQAAQPVEETARETTASGVCRPPLVEFGASVPIPAVLTG